MQKKPKIEMGLESRAAVCAFPSNCIDSIHFFLVSDTRCEHISYVKLIGIDQPEKEVKEMDNDKEDSKFIKMKIVSNRYILILILCYSETESRKVNEEEDTTLSNKLGEWYEQNIENCIEPIRFDSDTFLFRHREQKETW